MSSQANDELPAVKLDIPEGREFLWGKTKLAFKYIYKNHIDEADWFLKADDDSYVLLENLRYMLKDLNPKSAIYMGRHFKPYVQQGYMSGGAGYVLSKEAVVRFVTVGLHKEYPRCRTTDGGAEDMELGRCLERVSVRPVDSRDAHGLQRFHPFQPLHHIVPNLLPPDLWLYKYDMYPLKAVSFDKRLHAKVQILFK